ncbi:MAG TPA: hypothetical protein VG168_13045, partial [Bryobacteraceae bacterium]|nr:hypothetical protein [Bryobacteraceae bacterium]
VRGTAAFCGVLAGEAAIFAAALFTNVSFLWYNVIGTLVVIAAALVVEWLMPSPTRLPIEVGKS